MTSNRFSPRSAPLKLDISRAFHPFTAISRTELIALNDRLSSVRRELLGNCDAAAFGSNTAFVAYPEQMLAEYKQLRRASELGKILAAGKRIRESYDRVVIVGGKIELAAARALFEAACHPYHNELSRGDRGGRPNIYFAGDEFDNDAMQGLIDLLNQNHGSAKSDNRWMIIAIDAGESPTVLATVRCLLSLLDGGGRCENQSVAAITRSGSSLEKITSAIAGSDKFDWPSGAPSWATLFTAAGVLPASVMGLDVVLLLKGAAAMTDRFRAEPPGDNPPLDLAAAAHAVAMQFSASGAPVPLSPEGKEVRGEGEIRATSQSLEATADWYDHVRSAISGPIVATLQINLLAESLRRDRLVVPAAAADEKVDPPAQSGKSFAELQSIAFNANRKDSASGSQPAVDIVLPSLEEHALGQLFQLMIFGAAIGLRMGSCQPE